MLSQHIKGVIIIAIAILKEHDKYNASNHMEFVIDADSDVALLPGLDICSPGSKAVSIASGKAFYLTTFGFWTANTKALITEELIADAPGTYIADEGKAFNPVIVTNDSFAYSETIEDLLRILIPSDRVREFVDGVSNGSITLYVDSDIAPRAYGSIIDDRLVFNSLFISEDGGKYELKGLYLAYEMNYGNLRQNLYIADQSWRDTPIDAWGTLTIVHHPMEKS